MALTARLWLTVGRLQQESAVDYQQWEAGMPESVRGDPIWRMTAYRLAEYLADMSYPDALELSRNKVTARVGEQLYSALGSVAANIAEGYSRSSGLDRVRIFEYALGSAREARSWYFRSRPVLPPAIVDARVNVLSQIICILLAAIPAERKRAIRRSPPPSEH